MRKNILVQILFLVCASAMAADIVESAREIPLAYDVDVVVVGGSTRAVAAAIEAKKAGATVFLAAPRPYLGEDMCATSRFWLEEGEVPRCDLSKAIFADQPVAIAPVSLEGLKYSYLSSIPSSPKHRDTKKPSLLFDGKCKSASKQSVQYDGDVTITADLGRKMGLDRVVLLAYQRVGDFEVARVEVSTSPDKKTWTKPIQVKNPNASRNINENVAVGLSAATTSQARYVRIVVKKTSAASRVLLAELIIKGKGAQKSGIVKAPAAPTRVTRPMHLKRVLDKALLDAKVKFLYGCYTTDVLRDRNGRVAGIVMANRSGRQAVRAKVIIDATDRALVTRLTGAKFTPYPKGKHQFKRIVFGGTPKSNAKAVGISYPGMRGKSYKVYEYTLELPMADGSWQSFAKADQEARNRTWQEGQAGASEELFQVPPDPLKSRKQGDDLTDLDALRPSGLDGIYVLSGSAGVSRAAAAKIVRPIAGMALGRRVGVAAAKEAKTRSIGSVGELTVACEKADGPATYEIGEMLSGWRSMKSSKSIKSPARKLPVLAKYDVVIIGGGTGGAPAGIGAARAGAKTLVVEYLHGLGGVGTLGRITKYYHGNKVGFTTEIDKGAGRSAWNIEKKMEWFRSELVKAGGDVWFLTSGCGSVLKGNRFVGAVVATPLGRGIVLANTVIDSTGNAVIPACAGIKCQEIRGEHISVQGTGLPPMTPGESYLNTDWTFCDDDDVVDMWRMMVVGKKKFPSYFDLGQLINTRARRRIIGDIVITPMDIINKRTYPDVITVAKSNFDNHGFSSHTLFMVTPPDRKGLVANIPYRALMPKGYDGMLVTGLGISAHGDAMPVMRMQPDVQNQGYAAGYAAAMAAESGTTVRKIDIKKLQKHLVKKGIIPEKMLDMKDSYPIGPERLRSAVKELGKNYGGISIVLADPKQSLPLLRSAYRNTNDEKEKLRYAHVLGMLYDDTGAKTLAKAVASAKWDKGWNFRGMGQYGATTSPVDNLIIALGRTKDRNGVSAILARVKQLTEKSDFSHCRAVSIALENLRDPRAAAPLANLLQEPGVMGHAFNEISDIYKRTPVNRNDNSTRNNSLRELVLARALYRCGDHNGLAKKILEGYSRDMRGLYAAHAKAILAKRQPEGGR